MKKSGTWSRERSRGANASGSPPAMNSPDGTWTNPSPISLSVWSLTSPRWLSARPMWMG